MLPTQALTHEFIEYPSPNLPKGTTPSSQKQWSYIRAVCELGHICSLASRGSLNPSFISKTQAKLDDWRLALPEELQSEQDLLLWYQETVYSLHQKSFVSDSPPNESLYFGRNGHTEFALVSARNFLKITVFAIERHRTGYAPHPDKFTSPKLTHGSTLSSASP